MMIDRATIVTGSFNFTKAAEKKNAENLLVIKDAPALVKAYETTITMHAGHSHPYKGREAAAVSSGTPQASDASGDIHGTRKVKSITYRNVRAMRA